MDVAGRIAGTGSVGLQRYVLLVWRKETGNYLLLDIKEARPSSLQPYLKIPQPVWNSEADRIITIQKRVQYVSPAGLRPFTFRKAAFVLKELQPVQDKMDLGLCKGKEKKRATLLNSMTSLTAAAQLRSTGRQGSSTADELIGFAGNQYLLKKKRNTFAQKAALQTVKIYEEYCREYRRDKKKAGSLLLLDKDRHTGD